MKPDIYLLKYYGDITIHQYFSQACSNCLFFVFQVGFLNLGTSFSTPRTVVCPVNVKIKKKKRKGEKVYLLILNLECNMSEIKDK